VKYCYVVIFGRNSVCISVLLFYLVNCHHFTTTLYTEHVPGGVGSVMFLVKSDTFESVSIII